MHRRTGTKRRGRHPPFRYGSMPCTMHIHQQALVEIAPELDSMDDAMFVVTVEIEKVPLVWHSPCNLLTNGVSLLQTKLGHREGRGAPEDRTRMPGHDAGS